MFFRFFDFFHDFSAKMDRGWTGELAKTHFWSKNMLPKLVFALPFLFLLKNHEKNQKIKKTRIFHNVVYFKVIESDFLLRSHKNYYMNNSTKRFVIFQIWDRFETDRDRYHLILANLSTKIPIFTKNHQL